MLIKIKNWINGNLIQEVEADDLKKAVETLVGGGANLYGADLGKYGGKLSEERPFLAIGPIGSRQDYLQVFNAEKGIFLKTGCFFGSIEEFEKALSKKDSEDKNLHEYLVALSLIRAHAELWK